MVFSQLRHVHRATVSIDRMGHYATMSIRVVRFDYFLMVFRDFRVVQFFERGTAFVRPARAVNHVSQARFRHLFRRLFYAARIFFRRVAIRVCVHRSFSAFCVVAFRAAFRARRPAFRVLVVVVMRMGRYRLVHAVRLTVGRSLLRPFCYFERVGPFLLLVVMSRRINNEPCSNVPNFLPGFRDRFFQFARFKVARVGDDRVFRAV